MHLPQHRAFTLIELLSSIGIIAVLSALLMAGVGKARNSTDRASSVASLRTIAGGLLSYAADNNGMLPDRLHGGQNPGYNNGDMKRLPSLIWSYIGSAEPVGSSKYQYAKAFTPTAYKRAYPSNKYDGSTLEKTYLVLNGATYDENNNRVDVLNYQPTPGIYVARPLAAVPLPSKNWMLVEIDQALYDVAPSVMGAKPSWLSDLSKNAINHPMRGVAYWDGRVEMTPASKTFSTQ